MPLPDLPHLVNIDDTATERQVREQVERTIAECESAAEDLQRQLEQRRFVASFLREFLDRPPTSRDRPPVPPVRLRQRARRTQLPDVEQVDRVCRNSAVSKPLYCKYK